MVSGYRKNDTIKRGYKYATITLAGDLAPIVLGVEPVKENSKWEKNNAPSYSKAEMVDRLLTKAEEFVNLDEVYLDRGFHSKEVYAAIDDRGITHTTPVPRYEEDLTAIENVKEHLIADAAVLHDLPVAVDGEVHHTAEYLYVPSSEKNGKYTVFITNRNRVETHEIESVCSKYKRRWDIKNQYKSIGECLPRTSSKDYRVRFYNFVLTTLMYNFWRPTDYLIKAGRDIEIRSPPEIGFKTFVRAFGNFLRDID
jgi:IS4 transposase